ncbi:MAG: type II toxin-antitoxin system HicA family toxin [Candidatus Omnitrophota bacterium]
MNHIELLERIIRNQQNVHFNDLIGLIESLGFTLERRKGSHHIYRHPKIREFLNLQDYKGKAKPYQIRQFLKLIERYDLPTEENP